jgi:predicted protein tyrosine phosphatase
MFELKVVGAEEAAVLIGEGWPTRIVTLRAMSGDVVGAHHLYVVVDDVTTVTDERHPTSTHLQQVLNFTQDLTDTDRLLVHCKGGRSRSPAMAIAICMQHGMTYREAFAHVAAIRSALLPNQLFIQHIDEHFGLNGKLVELAKEHRTHRSCLQPDGPGARQDGAVLHGRQGNAPPAQAAASSPRWCAPTPVPARCR